MQSASAARTILTFHTSTAHTLKTIVTAVQPFTALEEANRALFKQGTDTDHVVITESTIFHPQGGGQPSDEGTMTSEGTDRALEFTVLAARMDAVNDGQVLHLGNFSDPKDMFAAGSTISQTLDSEKRHLYSRLHTAGHVLGSAVRHLLEKEVPGFDELKASHFPDSAACEFAGLIDGKHKTSIQSKVDQYIEENHAVSIEFWEYEEFARQGVHAPDKSMAPEGEKFRVVRIEGCEVYPCGGTHVPTTKECGKTTVKKISRSKGTSRVSYTVEA
jgi:Ser-tRNA(Ala) deacylase AlaX